jgi:hypothetical protein
VHVVGEDSGPDPVLPDLDLDLLDPSELEARLAARLPGAHPPVDLLLGQQLQVALELLVQVPVQLLLAGERPEGALEAGGEWHGLP